MQLHNVTSQVVTQGNRRVLRSETQTCDCPEVNTTNTCATSTPGRQHRCIQGRFCNFALGYWTERLSPRGGATVCRSTITALWGNTSVEARITCETMIFVSGYIDRKSKR